MYKRIISVIVAICGIALVAMAVAAQPQQKSARFLDHLQVGQVVTLSEKDGRYEIGILPPNYQPLMQKVIEVGPDYLVLRDLSEVNDIIIPVYAIKDIRIVHIPVQH